MTVKIYMESEKWYNLIKQNKIFSHIYIGKNRNERPDRKKRGASDEIII